MKASIAGITCILSCSLVFCACTSSDKSDNTAVLETPTMGWSSWNTYRVNISDELIMKQADAMKATGLGEAGYTYINIDDGYFGGRDAEGNLYTHPERFPNGLKGVVDHIHALGFKAGIYSDAGRNTCGNFWDNDKAGKGVGLYGHDEQDADFFFNRMGFDFIKIDFCGGDAKQNSEQLDLDERTRYTAIREAIDRTGRKDVRINICRWAFPGTWAHDVGSSWRISPDISVHWESIKIIIEKNLYLSAYAGEGHYNDMDMLEVGRGLGDRIDLTHFGMWCMMSSPLLIGCDLTEISEETLELLTNKELIAINQDRLGLQANVVTRTGDVLLLAKDIETTMGNKRAFAVYNAGNTEAEFTVEMEKHLNLTGNVVLRNAGTQSDAGILTNGILKVSVPPRGASFFVATADGRIEPTVYEAENAWLDKYNALEFDNEHADIDIARVMTNLSCSGERMVGRLGTKGNWLEWRNVYSSDGGEYELTIKYMCRKDRKADLTVNGETIDTGTFYGNENKKGNAHRNEIAEKILKVKLNKGMNTIRIGNEAGYAPDIDCIVLKKRLPYTTNHN